MSEKHESLTAALAAFQAEIPTVAKSNEATIPTKGGGGYAYSYADLSDVTAVALPLLGKHGLAWVTIPTMTDAGGFVLRYELRHESGDAIEGVYPLPAPTMQAQQVGMAITYARRYAFCAVTGIAPGGDDTDAAPPAATAPSEDWLAAIWSAPDVAALQVVANRLAAAREGTEQLRVAYATKRGQLDKAVTNVESGDGAASASGDPVSAGEPGGDGAADHAS